MPITTNDQVPFHVLTENKQKPFKSKNKKRQNCRYRRPFHPQRHYHCLARNPSHTIIGPTPSSFLLPARRGILSMSALSRSTYGPFWTNGLAVSTFTLPEFSPTLETASPSTMAISRLVVTRARPNAAAQTTTMTMASHHRVCFTIPVWQLTTAATMTKITKTRTHPLIHSSPTPSHFQKPPS